jgi:hypothetical protein
MTVAKRFQIFAAIYWTGMYGFSAWTLTTISFTTGETSTPLYLAAWFGQFGLAFQAIDSWGKVVKRDA